MALYYAHQQIDPGTYSLPLIIGDNELLISTIQVPGFGPANTVTIRVSVHWQKPLTSDIGQLDLMLRLGGEGGLLLADTEATCYEETTSKLVYSAPSGTGADTRYVLLAKSVDRRALITGPITVEAVVV